LLRGVSSNSGADRFAGGDDDDAGHGDNAIAVTANDTANNTPAASSSPSKIPSPNRSSPSKIPSPSRRSNDTELPPWKRGKAKGGGGGFGTQNTGNPSAFDDDMVLVAAKPKPPRQAVTLVEEKKSSSLPLPPPSSQDAIMAEGGNLQQKSTFQGDRGGDAHDEELLALLRGVSAKSSTADRFGGGNDDGDDNMNQAPEPPQQQQQPQPQPLPKASHEIEAKEEKEEAPPSRKHNNDSLPPWKRGNAQQSSKPIMDTVDVVVASKPPQDTVAAVTPIAETEAPQSFGQDSIRGNLQQKSTFQGDRGGDAHDEELLALLRGVSTKASSADRFAGGDVTERENDVVVVVAAPAAPSQPVAPLPKPPASSRSTRDANENELPPWKRGKAVAMTAMNAMEDVIVSIRPLPESEDAIAVGGGNLQQKSSFQGDRGGDAHDEELLALLRGVSSKSGADRFGGGDDEIETNNQMKTETVVVPVKAPAVPSSPPPKGSSSPNDSPQSNSEKKKKRWKMTPPWKKKNKKKQQMQQEDTLAEDDVIVVASPRKQPAPNAFPAVAMESASHNERVAVEVAAVTATAPTEGGLGNFQQGPSSFQGERGGDAHDEELLALLRGASSSRANSRFGEENNTKIDQQVKVAAAAPASAVAPLAENIMPASRGNFQQESTFEGERGGDAHDEELLALLRGVSSSKTSGSSDRFAEPSESAPAPKPPQLSPPKPPAAAPRQPMAFQPTQPALAFASSSSALPSPFPTGDGEEEIVVSLDDLPGAFSDKNWKVRKTAYEVLKDSIVERSKGGEPLGSVGANTIVPGLDDLIPTLFAEKNAIALEGAMRAGTEYANACRGGTSEEQAIAMMKTLLKGSGLSSPRPSSAKVATALVLKLMEVGSTVSSLKSVVSLLVEKGLTAKKPKVVQLSASLILDAAHSFGAAQLPLASIASTLPKVLTNSNKKIRDTGMEIVAEFCRSFGSKDPLEGVIGKMQKSQVKDLDALLAKRADPIPTKIGLRCQSTSSGSKGGSGAASAADVFAALQAGSAELEKEKFAKRPAVKLMVEIAKTNYASELQEAKWSKKVGALDMILKCGGETPYKLALPSSSNNYPLLISDMRGLLKHTHFAVVSKAMAVLGMLAQGVGEKLYSNLRPLLPKLLQISKDKKLTKAVSACLDAFFGNVLSYEHLLDSDSSIADATSETKEKNALARTLALDYLDRCVTRGDSAGSRASLTRTNAKACAELASKKLGDSDAKVRKSALMILTSLQKVDDDGVQSAVNSVVDDLQQSNPRAYKTLSKTAGKPPIAKASILKSTPSSTTAPPSPHATKPPSARSLPPTQKIRAPIYAKTAVPSASHTIPKPARGTSSLVTNSADGEMPTYEEALAHCGNLGIPLWDEPSEDDGGVLVGIQSAKWQSRQAAIKELIGFVNTSPSLDDCSQLENDTNCLLVVVKEHTRKFKESNMNVTRCILELLSAVCDYHERSQCRIAKWVATDGTAMAVEKIADRKLSSLSKALLISLNVVHPPQVVITSACACAEKLRAPLAREEFLLWMKTFWNEFGVASIGSSIQETVAFLLSECGHKNIKVNRAAFATMGLMHVQLGPTMKAVTLSSIKTPSLRDEIEKVFGENPFDSSISSKEWPKNYIFSNSANDTEDGGDNAGSGMNFELPKMDLMLELPSDCLARMGCKEGKTAWKARKAALEDVEKALKSSSGLLDTSKLRPLQDLLRAMRERLSDSQSNLKPLAARIIGLILGAMEGEAQGKLGKLVYAPVLNAAMNDKRKVMNDAAMEALKKATSIPEMKGEGLNEHSLEQFVIALTSELDGSEFKSAGIAGILTLTKSFVPKLSDLDKISSQRGETVGGRFSGVLVNALSSSKVEIRSAAESLLSECIANKVFSMQTAKKWMGRMVPAKQRSVGMILAKIASSSSASSDSHTTKETASRMPPRTGSIRAPPVERENSKPAGRSAIQKPKPTARAQAPKSRLATHSKSSVQQELEEPDPDNGNPLVVDDNPTGIHKSRASMRLLTWPEYPEEPSGAPLYNGLKKAWAPIIPPTSTKELFPDRGIRNQSDVNDGFDLLRQAIRIDTEDQGSVVVEQLHFILRWSVYVMGCKESAVGLTGLLDMLSELISYLNGRMHEFSDAEVSLFVPFIYEKASVAKGRFKDTYMDLITAIKSESLISYKRLGPFVCVALMENSSQAKARLLACQNCHQCVDAIGLSGIGKKGVLVAAKALSTDKLPENRAAFLDLMVLLVSKMQNDVQRLSKICGSSLSLKARGLVEEHMKKAPTPSKITLHKTPSPQRPYRASRPSQLTPPTKLSFSPKREFVAPSVFEDELPALDLRRALRQRESPSTTPIKASELRPPSFPSSVQGVSISSSYSSGESNLGSSLPKPASSPIGAAASLRARLLKIREKNNLVPLATKPSETIEIPMSATVTGSNMQHVEDYLPMSSHNSGDSILSEMLDSEPVLESFLETIRKLLEKSHHIFETDDDLLSCTDVLKNIHAAVSKQANLAVMISPICVENLREEIRERASEVVGVLTRLIRFGFNCHSEHLSAGMSVPLLSVNLASLMAIFRSNDLATLVNVDDLTILIREAGTALLDPRLAQSTKQGDVALGQIDEATSTQMVRAINKLAVQAATGATRENSIQALITLQDQLSSNAGVGEDAPFNHRLSRVVTKLSTRVIKAEESTSQPFSSSSMDMETILCFLEDTLDACRKRDQPEEAAATKHIVKSVVTGILKARRECTSIRQEMDDLQIDTYSSSLGELVGSIASDLGLTVSKPPQNNSENHPENLDVGSLVSNVVSAAQGPERTAAIDALKSYRTIHGDIELMHHLEDVSPAFRSYLVKELSETPSTVSVSTNEMSERIKNLRSKLNANTTDSTLSQAGGPTQASTENPPPSKAMGQQQRMRDLRQKLTATQAALPEAATTLPPPSAQLYEQNTAIGDGVSDHTGISTNTMSNNSGASYTLSESDSAPSSNHTITAFRERLAAAKEKQAAIKSSSTEIASPMPTASASSRAAALRARLQAVKMQTQI
jgi:cytoskeleton-associated protein 5